MMLIGAWMAYDQEFPPYLILYLFYKALGYCFLFKCGVVKVLFLLLVIAFISIGQF